MDRPARSHSRHASRPGDHPRHHGRPAVRPARRVRRGRTPAPAHRTASRRRHQRPYPRPRPSAREPGLETHPDRPAGGIDPSLIHEADVAARLPHPDLPDVDLLWRTSGEQRTSNFLPWQATYAELYFTDSLWPDIDRRHLWQAVTTCSRRQRRHGATPPT
ncbi:undecaprenyl diphosphate synthase family protein [Streptomyces sp. V4I8]|uniref:undecaprenyl diphosphate synthase family protein n=1 Tax=Streptomyces sp. V4I8 TaxID=3156469 RepID=UPI0035170794